MNAEALEHALRKAEAGELIARGLANVAYKKPSRIVKRLDRNIKNT